MPTNCRGRIRAAYLSVCRRQPGCSNGLQLSSSKTEVLRCTATSRRQHQLPAMAAMIDSVAITPVPCVRDLGIYIDDLSMRTVSSCFAVLCQLRQTRRSVPAATFQSLVVALVQSRLDYDMLVGIPAYLMGRLQSVLKAAGRMIFRIGLSYHTASTSLDWLRVPKRIQYKIAVLTFKVFRGSAP